MEDTIVNWAEDARRLTVFLLNHGEVDPSLPEWFFYVDASVTPRQVLSGSEFDRMLDEAQTKGLAELAVVVDMCYAGGFLKQASEAPEGYERVILTSTTDERLANFGGARVGGLSFTYFLLSELIKGVTLFDAYQTASGIVSDLRVPANAPQRPWLDDDGDGRATLQDGAVARRMVLGDAVPFGAVPPELIAVPGETLIEAPQSVPVEIEVGPGRVDGAEAIIVWSGSNYIDGQPITDIAVVPMTREGTSSRWSATIPASTFPGDGAYNVLYTAYREDPLSEEIRFSSNVMTQQIVVGEVPPSALINPILLGRDPSSPAADRNADGVIDAGDVR